MSADGLQVLGDDALVFDGHARHPTIEGPKFYKRHGYYYIFAPGGGVPTGWQTVLRSRNVFGPYEDRMVMDQGKTAINGPHQGAWVDTPDGKEDWFLHFQDQGPYGRVVHLQPMAWKNDWPVIGADPDGDGKGEPVLTFRKPRVPGAAQPLATPATSDEFSGNGAGPAVAVARQPAAGLGLSQRAAGLPAPLRRAAARRFQELLAGAQPAAAKISGRNFHGHHQARLRAPRRWRKSGPAGNGARLRVPVNYQSAGPVADSPNHLPRCRQARRRNREARCNDCRRPQRTYTCGCR